MANATAPGERELVIERIKTLLDDYDPDQVTDAELWGRQFDAGLAWVHFLPGFGGLGVAQTLQPLVQQALTRAGAPDAGGHNPLGVHLAAPTILAFGRKDQQHKHLRRLFTCEDMWCQLFSEPGAGSDIASLATQARHDGPNWIVNGQKIWTSLGHVARWGLLCARTDPDVPKHQGLTYFILDMQTPGVDIRPLRQITGDAEFNEVYLTDVVIPDSARLGEVGQGWQVTLSTLASERAMFGRDVGERGEGSIGQALHLWREHGKQRPHLRDRLVELAVEAEVLRLTQERAVEAEHGGQPSPAWSFLKLAGSELDQRIYDFAVTLLGPEGLTYPSYEMRQPQFADGIRGGGSDVRRQFLFARALTIAGGTSEVQRTIIADRVLRLPREPQDERNTPWNKLPRN